MRAACNMQCREPHNGGARWISRRVYARVLVDRICCNREIRISRMNLWLCVAQMYGVMDLVHLLSAKAAAFRSVLVRAANMCEQICVELCNSLSSEYGATTNLCMWIWRTAAASVMPCIWLSRRRDTDTLWICRRRVTGAWTRARVAPTGESIEKHLKTFWSVREQRVRVWSVYVDHDCRFQAGF